MVSFLLLFMFHSAPCSHIVGWGELGYCCQNAHQNVDPNRGLANCIGKHVFIVLEGDISVYLVLIEQTLLLLRFQGLGVSPLNRRDSTNGSSLLNYGSWNVLSWLLVFRLLGSSLLVVIGFKDAFYVVASFDDLLVVSDLHGNTFLEKEYARTLVQKLNLVSDEDHNFIFELLEDALVEDIFCNLWVNGA